MTKNPFQYPINYIIKIYNYAMHDIQASQFDTTIIPIKPKHSS